MKHFFDLNPDQIKIREILKNKNFVEIEVYSISNAEPNRNGSCFTLEAMKKGINTFNDKPIMGFFNKDGDFEQHNGKPNYDSELNTEYWDNEEQILGFIREADHKEIVEKDGLSWICNTAMVYTQYNHKQIKRLLKDKHKKVSVEVIVNESEVRNGIEYINDFELVGITILGSKKGIAIQEGIAGAHLSVLDMMEEGAYFNNQKQALCFAYENLDKNKNKEVNALAKEEVSVEPTLENEHFQEDVVENEADATKLEEDNTINEVDTDDTLEMSVNEDDIKMADDSDDNDNVDDENDNENEDDPEDEEDYVAEIAQLKAEKEELLKQCGDLQMKCDEYEKNCNDLQQQCDTFAEKVTTQEKELERVKDYDDVTKQLFDAKQILQEIHLKEQEEYVLNTAQKFNLLQEDVQEIVDKCKNSQFASNEDIDKEIGYVLFKKQQVITVKESDTEHFQTSIVNDDTAKQIKNKSDSSRLVPGERLKTLIKNNKN